ncbi:hypothetical protein UFOVP99_2 [uncultured Caudovirales phage]|uniref:Uncharacterized protein n=1 Tax=uncultured Caudovirales phage TaxID=2100421 RepID=A0A6J5L875_9CAUD|nr:hypothetical protein UFOVP99_2 [uncultured Caudovirales phage]
MTGPKASQAGGSSSAERMRRKRERDRQALLATQAAAQAEPARQARLPLAPVAAGDFTEEQERIGGGRPAGSVARATAAMRDVLLRRYPSPLIGLAEIAARPVEQLARELGCTRLEAFQEQRRALESLAPYMHSKMPIAVQSDGAPMVGVQLAVSADMAARIGLGVTVENQQDSGGEPA